MKHVLRNWQTRALESWIAGGCRGIIEVVTGGGKTVFAEACIQAVLENRPSFEVVVVVPTTSLADQWAVSLVEEGGLPSDEVGIFRRNAPSGLKFRIAIINTARGNLEQLIPRPNSTLLIVDECHRAGSDVNSRVLTSGCAATLGLSATPERPYDTGLEDRLIPALGPIIYRYGLSEARADGVASPFDLVNVRVPLLADEEARYGRVTRQIARRLKQVNGSRGSAEGDEQLAALMRKRSVVANRAQMRIPVAVKLLDAHSNSRSIVFHESVTATESIRALALKRGHSVTSYHTQIASGYRRENLRLFRRGVFNVLCTCRALDEGLNVPEIEIAVVAAATSTRRQRIQRLGRVLRPSAEKKRAIIYTIYASDVEERRLIAESEQLHDVTSVRWMRAGGEHGPTIG